MLDAGGAATLGEDVAHHARVRRLAVGDAVRLTNGEGTIAEGTLSRIAKAAVDVAVGSVRQVPRQPAIHLLVPIGDRDRMLWLAEKAAELAVESWQPVVFRRSRSVSPRGEGPAFAAKVRARMIAALEQSAGAWLPELWPEIDATGAAGTLGGATRFVLDAGAPGVGTVLHRIAAPAALVVGPEGGMEADELAAFIAAGWQRVSLGDATLRFETAAIAGTAVLRAALAPNTEN